MSGDGDIGQLEHAYPILIEQKAPGFTRKRAKREVLQIPIQFRERPTNGHCLHAEPFDRLRPFFASLLSTLEPVFLQLSRPTHYSLALSTAADLPRS